MRINYIEFENIASYGNKRQRLDFKNKEALLNLVVGKNGAGKSTIAAAILFALYGKTENGALKDLPNRINKNLRTKIDINCGNKKVVVTREIAPNNMKVLVNGVEIDIAGKNNSEEYLEKEVYGIPYQVYKNVIILSINDFKSFLTMNPSDKRNVIDKIFGFSIINDMMYEVKTQKKEIVENINTIDAELNVLTESLNNINNKITLVQGIDKKKVKSRKKEVTNLLTELSEKYGTTKDNIEKIKSTIVTASTKKDSIVHEYNKNNLVLNEAKKKLNLYSQSKCPTCETNLDSKFHIDKKKEFESTIESLPVMMSTLEVEVNTLDSKMTQLRDREKAVIRRSTTLHNEIRSFESELKKLSNDSDLNKSQEYKNLKSISKEFKENEDNKSAEKRDQEDKKHFTDTLELVLGDDGIKKMAVRSILPNLNTTIAAMLKKMHLNFTIKFDENFSSTITHLGEEINASTLSTGERKKADFITVIAIIKILKMRFPQLNVLFLDEIFSSVDADGIYNILTILSKVIKESGINTFVINHTVLPSEIFDNKIEISKENGFSKLNMSTID